MKKKRPPVTGTLVGVRLQPDVLTALDKHIAYEAENEEITPTRPDVIREALRHWLIYMRYLTEK